MAASQRAPGSRCAGRCRLHRPAGWSSSGWQSARLLRRAPERADGVWQIELARVDVPAPRRKIAPLAIVRKQSKRFMSQAVRLVHAHERDTAGLGPEGLGETAARRDDGHTERKAGHGARPATADAVRIGLDEQVTRTDVFGQRPGGKRTRHMHPRCEPRMCSSKVAAEPVPVLSEEHERGIG